MSTAVTALMTYIYAWQQVYVSRSSLIRICPVLDM